VTIENNIAKVTQSIRQWEKKYDRPAESVDLMAVSKTKSTALIEQAYACGLRHFGENYLQEATEKIGQLEGLGIQWHFIGPIQSNKTRAIAAHFDWVHTVDRLKIAQRLSDQRNDNQSALNICLQVNISGEASKSGVAIDEVALLADQVALLPRLHLRGLMAIPAPSDNFDQQLNQCQALYDVFQPLADRYQLDTLSMGMSADLEAAIAAGSTMVRVGTALFGSRN